MQYLLPYLPGRSMVPESVKIMLVAQGIHWVPEAGVAESHQLSVRRQTLERLPLKRNCISGDVLKHFGFEDKKTSIDPPVGMMRFFGEARNRIPFQLKPAKARRRRNRGHGSLFPVAAMKRDQGFYVDIGHAIPVGHHEGFVPDPILQAPYAAAGQGINSSIHHRYSPIGSRSIDDLFAAGLEINM